MEIPVALLLLCNIILILPCFCENNHNVTDKIDIKNVTITNSFASDLKKNYTSNILTKLLAEVGNTTSKQSGSKARKKGELIEPLILSNSNITIAKTPLEIQKNLNTPRPKISEENTSKNISQTKQVTTVKNDLNNKNLTDIHKNNKNSDKNKLLLNTNTTIDTNKNSTKTTSLQTIKLEGGSEIAINSVNKSENSKIKNSIKSTTTTSKIDSEKNKTINNNNNNSSKVRVNNNLVNLNSTNSKKINATVASNTQKLATSTTTTTTTTSTTTTSTTTTTTTTPKPKKPKITFSEEDVPAIGLYGKQFEQSEHNKLPSASVVEEPLVQPVKEDLHGNHRDYILPIVAFIFAVPILMGAAIISYRRIKDYWSTRHYRRMDFLVDGMYNE